MKKLLAILLTVMMAVTCITFGSSSVYADDPVPLPDPEDLEWGSGTNVYATTATWSWDHNDLREYLAGYNTRAYYKATLDAEEEKYTVGGPAYSSSKSYSDFFVENGEGYYRFHVKAVPYDDTPYASTEEVYSDWQRFFVLEHEIEAYDLDGEETDIDGNSLRQVYENGSRRVENGAKVYAKEGQEYSIEAVPGRGFAFEKFVIDGQEVTDNPAVITVGKSQTIKAVFKEDESVATININFGEGHIAFAKKVYQMILEAIPAESLAPYSLEFDEETGVISFNHQKSGVYEYEAIQFASGLLYEVVQPSSDTMRYDDEGEFLFFPYNILGKKKIEEYDGFADLMGKEYQETHTTFLSDSLDVYLLWWNLVDSADVSVDPLYCNTEIEVKEVREEYGSDWVAIYYVQEPAPSISDSEDSPVELVDEDNELMPLWFAEKPEEFGNYFNDENWYEGKVTAGDELVAGLPLAAKFGYMFSDDAVLTVDGKEVAEGDLIRLSPSYVMLFANVKAEHKWSDPEYVWADDNSTVTASRYCENEEDLVEEETVPANADITPATCEDDGKIVYTSEEFVNKAFEVQTKEEALEAIGHDWGDWIVVKEPTATEKGLKRRVCKNDPEHTEEEEIPAKGEEEPTSFYITLDLNGGELDGMSGEVVYLFEEGAVMVLPEPTREGYELDYWEGSKYYAGDKYTITEDHTFKAIWKEVEKEEKKSSSYTAPKTGVDGTSFTFLLGALYVAGRFSRKH